MWLRIWGSLSVHYMMFFLDDPGLEGYLQMLISHTVNFCSYEVVLFSVRSKEDSRTCLTGCFV
jgi:hypothetical protein